MKNIHPVVWILIAMFVFAFGFVGYGMYQQQQREAIRNQAPPVLPALKK